MKVPTVPTPAILDVLVMPNAEIICNGKSLGFVTGKMNLARYVRPLDSHLVLKAKSVEEADALACGLEIPEIRSLVLLMGVLKPLSQEQRIRAIAAAVAKIREEA